MADHALVTTIEDFEDGVLNVPGIVNSPLPPTAPPGDGIGIVLGPGPNTDSVDGDDGVIDGSGVAGHSFRSNSFRPLMTEVPTPYASAIHFDFLPDSHGNYPTAFGLVWTDGQTDSLVVFTTHEVGASGNVPVTTSIGRSMSLGNSACGSVTESPVRAPFNRDYR